MVPDMEFAHCFSGAYLTNLVELKVEADIDVFAGPRRFLNPPEKVKSDQLWRLIVDSNIPNKYTANFHKNPTSYDSEQLFV